MEHEEIVTESLELPDAGELKDLGIDVPQDPEFHRTLLEVWREVLSNVETERLQHISPQWSIAIIGAHPGLAFADMRQYRDRYFDKMVTIRTILTDEIAGDDQCLERNTVEDDCILNADHYKNLLLQWQLQILTWELDWECEAPDAAIEIAAIGDIHKFFFSQVGLVNHLESINFGMQYTEADQDELAAALGALKTERAAQVTEAANRE